MNDPSEWRLMTPGGIPYRVRERSGSFGYDEGSNTEEYIMRASDLGAFIIEGFPEPVNFLGTLFYPQQPMCPGLAALTPRRISYKGLVEGLPTDPFNSDPYAPEGTYQPYIVVTVEYGPTPTNDQQQDPNNPFTFLEVSANASGMFLNCPLQGKAEWELASWSEPFVVTQTSFGGETTPIVSGESEEVNEPNVPNTITETQVEWSVKWNSIPFTFWTGTLMGRLRAKLGKVNSEPMPLLHNAPADTILFMGYSASTSYTWREGRTGQSPIQLSMSFVEKNFTATEKDTEGTTHTVSVTHQHIYRPNFGWRKLKIKDNYLYTQTDLNNIWGIS